MKTDSLLGRSPDTLSFAERRRLAGKWIALQLYTPQNLALRKMEAVADSPDACIRILRERGFDPRAFELQTLK